MRKRSRINPTIHRLQPSSVPEKGYVACPAIVLCRAWCHVAQHLLSERNVREQRLADLLALDVISRTEAICRLC
jgi:hypothetical protein